MDTIKIIKEYLDDLGINLVLFISGVFGAFTGVKKEKLPFWSRVSTWVSGGLSATYLTEFIVELLNLSDTHLVTWGFIVGTSSQQIVLSIMKLIKNKIDNSDLSKKD